MNPLSYVRPLACRQLLASILAVWSMNAATAAATAPFVPGEKVTYRVKWGAIPAAHASFEVAPEAEFEGRPAYHFVMHAATSRLVDPFYKVRLCHQSRTDRPLTKTLLYQAKGQEGRDRKKDVTVRFDWEHGEARYKDLEDDDDDDRKPVEIQPGTIDPLAIFYAIRGLDLKPGKRISLPVTDGRRFAVGEAVVRRRETVKIGSKRYDTFLIEPDMKDVGGVFKKSREAKLQVWVTTDARCLPVKFRSKVIVGHFTGYLDSVASPQPAADAGGDAAGAWIPAGN